MTKLIWPGKSGWGRRTRQWLQRIFSSAFAKREWCVASFFLLMVNDKGGRKKRRASIDSCCHLLCVCVFPFSWDRLRCSFLFFTYFVFHYIVLFWMCANSKKNMNCHESNVKKVKSQDNAEEKKNANLNLYRKLPKRSKCGAFQPIIQKFHLSKIKKRKWLCGGDLWHVVVLQLFAWEPFGFEKMVQRAFWYGLTVTCTALREWRRKKMTKLWSCVILFPFAYSFAVAALICSRNIYF